MACLPDSGWPAAPSARRVWGVACLSPGGVDHPQGVAGEAARSGSPGPAVMFLRIPRPIFSRSRGI